VIAPRLGIHRARALPTLRRSRCSPSIRRRYASIRHSVAAGISTAHERFPVTMKQIATEDERTVEPAHDLAARHGVTGAGDHTRARIRKAPTGDAVVLGEVPALREDAYSLGPDASDVSCAPAGTDRPIARPNRALRTARLVLTILAAGTGATLGLTHSHAHAALPRPHTQVSIAVPDARSGAASATPAIVGRPGVAIGAPAASPQREGGVATADAGSRVAPMPPAIAGSADRRGSERHDAPTTAASASHESERARVRGSREADTTRVDPTPSSLPQRAHAHPRDDDAIGNVVDPSVLQRLVNAEQ